MRFTDINIDNIVEGIIPNQNVTIVSIKIISTDVADISYRDQNGNIGNQLVYGYQLDDLKILNDTRPFSFNGDGSDFRIAAEAEPPLRDDSTAIPCAHHGKRGRSDDAVVRY